MTGADFFLSVVTGVVSDSILSRLRGGGSLRDVLLVGLQRAVEAHQDLLRKHTDGVNDPFVHRDAFLGMWDATLECNPNDLSSAVPYLRDVILLPGCPLAPDDHANLLAMVLSTAKREFLAALPGYPKAKSEWDIACDISTDDKLDGALSLLSQIDQRLQSAQAQFGQGAGHVPEVESADANDPKVSLSKLPSTGPDLFGRDSELILLDRAWENPNANIVAFIAFGGVGKSALITHWLRRLAKDGYRGARRVFGWSFYSQGQREHTVSADLFIDTALRFFGDPNPNEGSPWDKGQRLATLVNQEPTILALDGIEPLQSTIEDGNINDPALDTLLRELAYGMNGLCLLTSRVDFPDLPLSDLVWEPRPRGDTGPALRVNLERLSTEAGRYLLRETGVKGLDDELDAAVEEYEGHALALVLLGEYLVKFLDADIAKRDLIPPFPDRTRAGRHAFRVMEAYDKALAKDGMDAERAILRVIGLFDRPADKGCLDALRQPPAIEGVTDPIVDLTDRQWREAVGTLRSLRLLSPPSDPDDGSLDAHPLVREWFGHTLEQESPEAFRQAHGRVYEYLRDHGKPTPDTEADSLEDLAPLLQAIRHACCAGQHAVALNAIFRRRLRRFGRIFTIDRLGALSADLAAVAPFFDEPWLRPATALSESQAHFVLGEAGTDLLGLGRLGECRPPLRSALGFEKTQRQWAMAARSAENLTSSYHASGDLLAAHDAAAEAIVLADHSQVDFLRTAERAVFAHTAVLRGMLARGRMAFNDAEQIQSRRQPQYPILYSMQGATLCILLLLLGKAAAARDRALRTLRWSESLHLGALLDVALDHLTLARGLHHLSHSGSSRARAARMKARKEFSLALAGLRRAGIYHQLPPGLLARASFHRDFGEREQAERDLKEALTLSDRIGLRLHETDARLLQGHMALDDDQSDLGTAEDSLARATQLVTETGYHLRDADLLILEGRLLTKKGDTEAGRAKLNDAIAVARREEKDGCVYQVAVDQANRYLSELA